MFKKTATVFLSIQFQLLRIYTIPKKPDEVIYNIHQKHTDRTIRAISEKQLQTATATAAPSEGKQTTSVTAAAAAKSAS